eukprot:1994632-Ditylum_brightwellii.AAC.1
MDKHCKPLSQSYNKRANGYELKDPTCQLTIKNNTKMWVARTIENYLQLNGVVIYNRGNAIPHSSDSFTKELCEIEKRGDSYCSMCNDTIRHQKSF